MPAIKWYLKSNFFYSTQLVLVWVYFPLSFTSSAPEDFRLFLASECLGIASVYPLTRNKGWHALPERAWLDEGVWAAKHADAAVMCSATARLPRRSTCEIRSSVTLIALFLLEIPWSCAGYWKVLMVSNPEQKDSTVLGSSLACELLPAVGTATQLVPQCVTQNNPNSHLPFTKYPSFHKKAPCLIVCQSCYIVCLIAHRVSLWFN